MNILKIVLKSNQIEYIQIIKQKKNNNSKFYHTNKKDLKIIINDIIYNYSKTYNFNQLVKVTQSYVIMDFLTKKIRPIYIPIIDIIYKFIDNILNIKKITNSNINYMCIVEILNLLNRTDYNDNNNEEEFEYRPVLNYTKDNLTICCPDSEQCSICFEQTDSKKYQLPCNHMFHMDCIKPWIDRMNTCPVCRAEISLPMNEEYAYDIIKRNLRKWIYKRRNTITHTISIIRYTRRDIKRLHRYGYSDTDIRLRRKSHKGVRNINKRQKKNHNRITNKTNCQHRTLRY